MIRFLFIAISVAFCLTGCVNPIVNTVKETKIIPSYNVPKVTSAPVLPKKDSDEYKTADSGKTYSLTLKNADVKDVLMLLSHESHIPIIQERNLRGIVKIEAQNKKLGELLFAVLKPLGYTANVENGVIIVGRPQLSTRTFRVNYLKDKRNSSSNMNVSGFSAGSVSVSSSGQSDFWGSLENSLEILVFGTAGKGKRDGGGYTISEEEKKTDSNKGHGSTAQSGTSSKNKLETSQSLDLDDPLLSSSQISEGQLKQLVVNEIAGIVQITDFSENLDKIASFLKDVEEGSKRQVMIQAHIMEVNLKDSFAMGLDWQQVFRSAGSTFTIGQVLSPASNVFKIGASGFNSLGSFTLLLDAMKEQGNLNMLSSPKISALNNQKAVIKLTTKQVSWVSSKTTNNTGGGSNDTYTTTPQVDEVGIFLDVTPQIGQDNTITMQIHPSVSEIKEISISPDKNSTKPIIDIREIDTMVDAKAGETIVIAGLISDKLNEIKRSVPILGDIPYMGALFSYNKQERTKAELVIMMTPYILNAKSIDDIRAEHEQRLRNMGGTFHLINNLGSMVTEQGTRNWMDTIPTLPAVKKNESLESSEIRVKSPLVQEPVYSAPSVLKSTPLTNQDSLMFDANSAEKKSELTGKNNKNSSLNGELVKKNIEQLINRVGEDDIVEPKSLIQKPAVPQNIKPTLESITQNSHSIVLVLRNIKEEPKLLRESKNRRIIIKLPGVQSAIGNMNLKLQSLGFDRVKVARHSDGIWVVLHSSEQQLPRVETHFNSDNLMITAAAMPEVISNTLPLSLGAIIPLNAKVSKKQHISSSSKTIAPTSIKQPVLLQNPVTMLNIEQPSVLNTSSPSSIISEKEKQNQNKQVAVITTTTNGEQSLYHIGVAAYKSGDCNEAIKQLSSFIASYPDSAFVADAAIYRGDCMEKSGVK